MQQRVSRWTHHAVAGLGGLAVLQFVAAAVLAVVIGPSFADALEAFVVTNSAMGVSFAVCGTILASLIWHARSRK